MPFSEENLRTFLLTNFMNAKIPPVEEKDDNKKETYINYDVNTTDKSQKINNRLEFKYLEQDSLSNSIEHERDYLKQYIIHLCLYKVEQGTRLPFLKFMFDDNENTFVLPNNKLNMRTLIEIKENQQNSMLKLEDDVFEDKETSEIDLEFLNQVNELYKNYFEKDFNKRKYKGFIEQEENIFVFFDITNENLTTKKPIKYGIIDEILNVKQLNNKIIDKKVTELFKTYEEIQKITVEGVSVQFPKVGYIINQVTDGDYENMFKKNEDILLIPPQNDYDEYEDVYIFSAIPLTDSNLSNIRRFACFIENFESEKEENEETFAFLENNIQFYGLLETDLFEEI
tara:strand:- start:65 stop:1087 length:1023 start_codon:yes stop_codon:yes gene_type:complete